MRGQTYCLVFLILLLYFFITMSCPLTAQTATLIDTIWTENSLQGAIGYHVQNGTYYGGIMPHGQYTFDVGDSYDQYSDFNDICLRAYFSFPIQQVPLEYLVSSVFLSVYLVSRTGNGQSGFPIWYDHQPYSCNLYHVDYGLSFEPDDFNPTIYDTLGSINSNAVLGWQNLDITEAYLQDMQEMRPYCQLMLKFPILTDYDQLADLLLFGSAYAVYHPLRVIITYIDPTINHDEVTPLSPGLTVYPNPCHDKVTITTKDSSRLISVNLYNLKGQLVTTNISTKANTNTLDLAIGKDLKSGLYLLRYTTRTAGKLNSGTRKLLINSNWKL